jgi:phenylalanyl-tRNA synthetase beta chain
MKISLNTIRFVNQHYGSAGDPAPEGVDALEQRIGAQLGAVEETIDFGSKYKDVVIVRVVSCVDHPNADRLHLCKVDDGGKVQGVERDEQGHVQIVCGAPNVRQGILAAWLPPSSTVPSTADKDPFVMESREIRGEKSNGMMASPKELGIGDSHEGILEVDIDVTPGTRFVDAYRLDGEVVIDIENKMFTHRPDCFGFMGVARELEGIQRRPYKSPEWYIPKPAFPGVEAEQLPLQVQNDLPDLVPRFTAITMRDVEIKPSPVWLQILLAEVGMRPINNIVDYTNFFMLETGQPLHAYDYDKVKAQDANADHASIVIRHPKEGERILLLNGKKVEPRSEAIMIASRNKLIGIGGVMGGGDTEVDEHTKNIIIEVATFDMYSIRRTSMAHGLFTDAVTRFNKGQSPLQNLAVLAKIVDEIRKYAGGKVASAVIDDNHLTPEVLERESVHAPVSVTTEFINVRLGLSLSADEISKLLQNVEFEVKRDGDDLDVTAPFWRTDIEIPEDVVEEVGRLYGYDHLLLDLPNRNLTPARNDQQLDFKRKVRGYLSQSGANEVLTYSFVHGNLLDNVGQDKSQAFQIANALSPDLQYYRLSLTPSLLEKIHPNLKAGHDEFALFELGKAHAKSLQDPVEQHIPGEANRIAFVYAANDKAAQRSVAGAAYYEVKKYLDQLLAELGLENVTYIPADQDPNQEIDRQLVKPFATGRTSFVQVGDVGIAVVGEFKASVRKALKLPEYVAGFEVDIDALRKVVGTGMNKYVPLPRFPKLDQDLCLKVSVGTSYNDLVSLVRSKVDELKPQQTLASVSPVDIYQRDDDQDHKQVTVRLSIASYERTLTDVEVTRLLGQVAQAAKEKFDADRV